jgi:hypothetical protein
MASSASPMQAWRESSRANESAGSNMESPESEITAFWCYVGAASDRMTRRPISLMRARTRAFHAGPKSQGYRKKRAVLVARLRHSAGVYVARSMGRQGQRSHLQSSDPAGAIPMTASRRIPREWCRGGEESDQGRPHSRPSVWHRPGNFGQHRRYFRSAHAPHLEGGETFPPPSATGRF